MKDPIASPAYLTSSDLAAIKASSAQIAIFQGEADITCPDTLDFVDRLRSAEIPVDLIFKEGLPHVYPLFPKHIPEVEEARAIMIGLIQKV